MAQFKRQKPLRTSSLQGAPRGSFPGAQPASLLGPAPGLLNPPISADIIQATRHLQGGEKQRVFTGIVTSLHDYFGVVDDEVFFQLSEEKDTGRNSGGLDNGTIWLDIMLPWS
uniref:S1-like RNA binding domain-containing protein n=2 Tax=Micrurus paraensis TaxID=1970185 RepID=A0A2D4K8N0_9SAUR